MRDSLLGIVALMLAFVVAQEAMPVHARNGPAYQGAAGRAGALTALDYAEIQMLYGRSHISFDSGADRGYAFARTFTPDGMLIARGAAPVTGHERLAALAAANTSCLQTWLTNLMIEPSPEGAVGWAYIWHIDLACGSRSAAQGAGSNTAVKEGGLYRDDIVKTAAGWRFRRRSYTPGHTMSKDEKPPA